MDNQIVLGSNAKKLLMQKKKKEDIKKKLRILRFFLTAFGLFAVSTAFLCIFFVSNKTFYGDIAKPVFAPTIAVFLFLWIFCFTIISFLLTLYIFRKGRIVITIELFANCFLFLLFPLFFFFFMSPFAALINILILTAHMAFMWSYSLPILKKMSWLFLPAFLCLLFLLSLNYCIIILN